MVTIVHAPQTPEQLHCISGLAVTVAHNSTVAVALVYV